MEVRFRSRELKKQYERYDEAEKKYGQQVARKFVGRINIMKQVRGMQELMKLQGLRCHPLRGDRKGHWAINITGYYRLIFRLSGEADEIIIIEEVSKHYGD